MRVINTSVKDVCASASAGRVVILIRCASLLTVRDAAETPGGTVLVDYTLNRDDLILLDVFDLVRLDVLHDTFNWHTYIRVVEQSIEHMRGDLP